MSDVQQREDIRYIPLPPRPRQNSATVVTLAARNGINIHRAISNLGTDISRITQLISEGPEGEHSVSMTMNQAYHPTNQLSPPSMPSAPPFNNTYSKLITVLLTKIIVSSVIQWSVMKHKNFHHYIFFKVQMCSICI